MKPLYSLHEVCLLLFLAFQLLFPLRTELSKLPWFGFSKVLHSGWAWAQAYLKDGVAAFVANVGKGKLYAFGPEITFKGQAQDTFKLLFKQLYQ